MTHEIFIGISIAVVVAVILGAKSIIHRVLTFKMDESAIVKFIAESSAEPNGELEFLSTEAISAGTDISASRVALVCSKSKLIRICPEEKDSWCVN